MHMAKNDTFTERFIEVCGSSRPADIQRLLNISYQAARNYLAGRLPSTETLLVIAKETHCSIDWLLTGRGKKFVEGPSSPDTPLPTGQLETFVRHICVEVINEMTTREPSSKIVVLRHSDVLSEKVVDEKVTFSNRGD